MQTNASVTSVADIRTEKSPALEAWLYHFFIENNIEYLMNSSLVASPEQLRFMVALNDDQIYIPCDDALFLSMLRKDEKVLHKYYREAWQFVVRLVASYNLSRTDSRRIIAFCRTRFQSYLREKKVLPSRMIKRLVSIVLSQCGVRDPLSERKALANKKATLILASPALQEKLYRPPNLANISKSMTQLRHALDMVEIKRLMALGTTPGMYKAEASLQDALDRLDSIDDNTDLIKTAFTRDGEGRKKILFILARSGWSVFDITLAKSLVRQGHQVILSLKDAFYFNAQTLWDVETDPILHNLLADALVLDESSISKNTLLRLLREHKLLVISDGTSEQVNLYRASVTFARAWKESDLVITSGIRQQATFHGTSHQFTRDILSFWLKEDQSVGYAFKPRAKWSIKFAEQDLVAKAAEIIGAMQEAKENGYKVMFYSAIIGSVPGQTSVAISLVNAFVEYLRYHLENTFIINPAEHFVEGMDGDDLMFMWERVQRSGLLDVWRFQTSEDIEKSFSLVGKKVPAVWLGKDSTFSTGCTKEMMIAIDVQKNCPELQILGPRPDLFFRRRDYGVGKYYDATIKG